MNRNYKFFEEFKKLENLCDDIFKSDHGVTKYINRMSETDIRKSGNIKGWRNDYYMLKKLRHIRNYLAHDGSFSEKLLEKEDLIWLKAFKKRVIKRKDPLSLINNRQTKKKIKGSYFAFAVILLTAIYFIIKYA